MHSSVSKAKSRLRCFRFLWHCLKFVTRPTEMSEPAQQINFLFWVDSAICAPIEVIQFALIGWFCHGLAVGGCFDSSWSDFQHSLMMAFINRLTQILPCSCISAELVLFPQFWKYFRNSPALMTFCLCLVSVVGWKPHSESYQFFSAIVLLQ